MDAPEPSPVIVASPFGVGPGVGVLSPGTVVLPAGQAGPQVAAVQLQVWQGQFPPPDVVEAYNRASPGAFDRIITMAEKQQDAQIEINRSAAAGARQDTRRGHWLGASVTLSAIAAAVACAWLKQPIVAGLLCGVPVLTVANILVSNARGVGALRAIAAASAEPAKEASPTSERAEHTSS